MVSCPWCGTNYTAFQPSCANCGGSLPLPAEIAPEPTSESLAAPPPPPRKVPQHVLWRILFADGWAIAGLVFALLGLIFGVLGAALTLAIVTALVGIPFAGLGALFVAAGALILVWRYRMAQRTVEVLERGEAALGEIVSVHQNTQVQINGRHPWTVAYRFDARGRQVDGQTTTLSRPDLSQQPGRPVYVLYMWEGPDQNTIYPSPYGYYGL